MFISTRTVMGGKNSFLGIAYIVVGGLCIILGVMFTFAHLIKPRYVDLAKTNFCCLRFAENLEIIRISLGTTQMRNPPLRQAAEMLVQAMPIRFCTYDVM